MNRIDADRALGGDRGDRRRPVDADRRERLQVRLDPGAATGVGARDRERHGCPFRVHGKRL